MTASERVAFTQKQLNSESFCGMTWGWTGVRGTWATDAAATSMAELPALGVNWVGIAFGALQATAHSTVISFDSPPTVTDDEVRWAIREAKSLGMRVCLKPVVNVADGTWRAHISFFDVDVPGEPSWSQWFASYQRFILHYAAIAEDEGCEMLCVGCEMVQSDKRSEEWRLLIDAVRGVFGGLLTYNCDKYQEQNVTWWDAVDVISSSGYYPLGSWDAQLDRIAVVAEREAKPFFFMESGCPSRAGSAAMPNDWNLKGEPSESEQSRWYADAFDACRSRSWMQGFMLWDWPAELYSVEDAARDDDYCVFGKSASLVVASEYRRRAGAARS